MEANEEEVRVTVMAMTAILFPVITRDKETGMAMRDLVSLFL